MRVRPLDHDGWPTATPFHSRAMAQVKGDAV
jgi:hypothetical protein